MTQALSNTYINGRMYVCLFFQQRPKGIETKTSVHGSWDMDPYFGTWIHIFLVWRLGVHISKGNVFENLINFSFHLLFY